MAEGVRLHLSFHKGADPHAVDRAMSRVSQLQINEARQARPREAHVDGLGFSASGAGSGSLGGISTGGRASAGVSAVLGTSWYAPECALFVRNVPSSWTKDDVEPIFRKVLL